MFKIWNFFIFFLLCLVIGLFFNLPIQRVLPYVELPTGIKFSGVGGTVLQGKADQLSIDQFPLNRIRYRYMPSCIALLKVCYQIDYERGQLQIAYDTLNGDTEVTNVKLEYRVRELNPILPTWVVQPVGRLEIILDELQYIDGKPNAVNGNVIWRDLGIDDTGVKIDVGDYQIDFTGNREKTDFKIFNLDADLDVDGKGELRVDGSYNYELKISSGIGIDRHIKSVLDVVGKKTGPNKYRVIQRGQLSPQVTRQLFE